MNTKELKAAVKDRLKGAGRLEWETLSFSDGFTLVSGWLTRPVDKKKVRRPVIVRLKDLDEDHHVSPRQIADALLHVHRHEDDNGSTVVHHWLHGARYFKVFVEKETACRWCTHSFMCSRDVSKLCINFRYGCSGRMDTCETCHHHYTQHDAKQLTRCFKCRFFQQRRNNIYMPASFYEVRSNPTPPHLVNWWRRGVCNVLSMDEARSEILADTAEHSFGGPEAAVEFIPITVDEYGFLKARIDGGHMTADSKVW